MANSSNSGWFFRLIPNFIYKLNRTRFLSLNSVLWAISMLVSVPMTRLIPKLKPKQKALSVDTTDHQKHKHSEPASSSSSDSLSLAKPIVKSKNWEAIFDPTLSTYYFHNSVTNQTQFDHPDEVLVSPVSPSSHFKHRTISTNDASASTTTESIPEYRRSFGFSLKRTLSPKFLHNDKNDVKVAKNPVHEQEAASFSIDKLRVTSPETHVVSPRSVSPSCESQLDGTVDEDVLEFQRQLELEMRDYECERIRNK